jgi:hypothetical protein
MSETVISTIALPELLIKLIPTEKVCVKEVDGIIQLVPVREYIDCTIGLRGMFAGDPELTVGKYLERKRTEKELDL